MTGSEKKVRVAALGDIHVNENNSGEIRELLSDISHNADVLVLCGDMTNRGRKPEAEALAEELSRSCNVPIVAVLGNHDFECGEQDEVRDVLTHAGVTILDDNPCEILGVGFAGVTGFCGGFDRHALAPFGEELIKRFVHETIDEALRLESGLARLRTEHRVVVLHYAPIRDTVEGEPAEIFPFLGSSRLVEPIERFRASAVVHGHAHNGTFQGKTASGIPVYNVALAIMQRVRPEHPYMVLEL